MAWNFRVVEQLEIDSEVDGEHACDVHCLTGLENWRNDWRNMARNEMERSKEQVNSLGMRVV